MDRRQQKTRKAIFRSFTELLGKKHFNNVTVQEIIDGAEVGRSTFYAHFDTKDDLLEALCRELFGHIAGKAGDSSHTHGRNNEGDRPESVFLHLLQHLEENDSNILLVLSSASSELFLRHFKDSLRKLVEELYFKKGPGPVKGLPDDFVINHISSCFVEMVMWWISGGKKESPEELEHYFLTVTKPFL